MKKTNLWSAAFLIAFSLVLLGWVIPNYTSDPQSDLDVRPSFIPNVAAGAILFLACLMLYNSLRRAKAEQEDVVDDEEFGDEASGLGLEELFNLVLWVITSTVTVILIDILGFSIVSSLFLIGLMLYAGQRNWIILILVGIIVPVSIWQITWHAFSIQLPMMKFLE
jgi:hypothetical protein